MYKLIQASEEIDISHLTFSEEIKIFGEISTKNKKKKKKSRVSTIVIFKHKEWLQLKLMPNFIFWKIYNYNFTIKKINKNENLLWLDHCVAAVWYWLIHEQGHHFLFQDSYYFQEDACCLSEIKRQNNVIT